MSDNHTFSRLAVHSWLKVGGFGLLIAVLAWSGGAYVEDRMPAVRGQTWTIVVQLTATAIRAFGMGFTFLFAMMFVAASLYVVLHGRR